VVELLLLKDVRKLGHVGDVVTVRPGYARNFLLPHRMAAPPTPENIKAIEQVKIRAAAERSERMKEFTKVAESLADVTITIEAAANPEGTLYGSVGAREIAKALQAAGHPVRAEHVMLDGPIRSLDNRTIRLEFMDEVTAQVKLWVVREGGTEAIADTKPETEPADEDADA
jgi:large subunit ribosomal protein L9